VELPLTATLIGLQVTATEVTVCATVCGTTEKAPSRQASQHKMYLDKAKPGGDRSARMDVFALIRRISRNTNGSVANGIASLRRVRFNLASSRTKSGS
jgi:hypothetical protein